MSFPAALTPHLFPAGQGPNLVFLLNTQDIPLTTVTMTTTMLPPNALGAILGCEIWYNTQSSLTQQARLNVKAAQTATDILRPVAVYDPRMPSLPFSAASMGQGMVTFENYPAQTFRYSVESMNSTVADKCIIIDLHGYLA